MKKLAQFIMLFFLLFVTACSISETARKQASYHYQMGLSFLGENNIPRALMELTEAEKITPDDPVLLNYLGMTYFYKKRYDLAEKKYIRALKINPKYSEARNQLGVNYLEMHQWDDALVQFRQVSEDLFFQHPEVPIINMGLAYFGKGDYQNALSILQGAVTDYPRVPQARVSLARVYLATGKTTLAIAELKTALEITPDYADAYYNLGLAYAKMKDNVAAAGAFRQVLKLAPDSDKAQMGREYLETLK